MRRAFMFEILPRRKRVFWIFGLCQVRVLGPSPCSCLQLKQLGLVGGTGNTMNNSGGGGGGGGRRHKCCRYKTNKNAKDLIFLQLLMSKLNDMAEAGSKHYFPNSRSTQALPSAHRKDLANSCVRRRSIPQIFLETSDRRLYHGDVEPGSWL